VFVRPDQTMPVQQYYPYDAGLFARRPSMLRIVGEAIISWADKREEARASGQHRFGRSPQELPAYLRRDLGLGPLSDRPGYWDRW
jgi:hypothetical protein